MLAVGFETGSLRIAEGLENGPVLQKELTNFRAKFSISGRGQAMRVIENDPPFTLAAASLLRPQERSP
jgi:hypothetical protein